MFVKLFDWLLDRDGEIYGDERSRFAWYEAIAGTASVQWIVIPWVLAILVWIAPTSAVWSLSVVMGVFFVTTMLCFPYLQAKHVDYLKPQTTKKARLVQVLTGLPMIVFVIGATVGVDLRNDVDSVVVRNGLMGGMVGAVVGGLSMVALVRRKRSQLALPEEEANG
jgi:heme/copper-type cytochrome/quinol oxidase subunit 2